MRITEIRMALADPNEEKGGPLAYCSVTFDDALVVHDIKIINTPRGPMIAMPSRKMQGRCSKCSTKNHLRARFCNQCGQELRLISTEADGQGSPLLYADVVHPVTVETRAFISSEILKKYEETKANLTRPR